MATSRKRAATKSNSALNRAHGRKSDLPGQVVLVLQGGGALGAYQVGVYEALHEAGIEPDWVIGTSIGAINGALIAGNPPKRRLARLHEFWSSVEQHAGHGFSELIPGFGNVWANLMTLAQGVPTFFSPNLVAWFGQHAPLGVEAAAYYTTEPLRETLLELVDFTCINGGRTRLTVGAVNVNNGEMRYFDSRDEPICLEHVMASGALPPAFPAVRVDGEPYWDGGIYSNTPLEAVLDDRPRHSSVIFTVQLWPAHGAEPASIREAMSRQRDIQYSSRAESHLERQRQIHRLRHVIRELGKHLPEDERETAAVKELLGWGCGTTMQVIELDAPSFERDELHKDIDFSAQGIRRRWQAGYADAQGMAERAPWRAEPDPMEGIAIHRSDPAAA